MLSLIKASGRTRRGYEYQDQYVNPLIIPFLVSKRLDHLQVKHGMNSARLEFLPHARHQHEHLLLRPLEHIAEQS